MTKVNADRIDRGVVLGDKVLVAEVFAKHGFLVLANGTEEALARMAGAEDGIREHKVYRRSPFRASRTESSPLLQHPPTR